MNGAIRRVGLALTVLLLVLAGQLTYLQLVRADDLNRQPGNARLTLERVRRNRGEIVTADGVRLAVSLPSNDVWRYQRKYLQGPLYAAVTGFQSILFGSTGVERVYDAQLTGQDVRLGLGNIDTLLKGTPPATVVLSVDSAAQQAAASALAGREGSVVALDVQTGGIVALYSNPTFDPNLLASHNVDAVSELYDALAKAKGNPMRPRAYRERFPPGSTFKVVTTALALQAGIATPERQFPVLTQLDLPLTTKNLANFGGEACGGTLANSFRVSCNTTFARLGLELGDGLATGIARFGLNGAAPPLDLDPGAVPSAGPKPGDFKANQPQFALAAIGQGDIAVTPLEMALVAESVATGGRMLVPYVVQEVRRGTTVRRTTPRTWRRVMDPATAATIGGLMVSVVNSGTGTAAQLPNVQVAGKTGTAESAPGVAPHAWFIAFAPAAAPRYAVAVIVERGGDLGNEATGGRVAAPVARAVLAKLLGVS